jgi:hypothetical protein
MDVKCHDSNSNSEKGQTNSESTLANLENQGESEQVDVCSSDSGNFGRSEQLFLGTDGWKL